jgi:glycosyltransferase involved in cell wall biosynthesis
LDDEVEPVQVLHVGPSSQGPGGMSSVIRTLVETAAYEVKSLATWFPGAPLRTLRAWLSALAFVVTRRRLPVLHAHVSEGGSWVREGSIIVVARLRGHRSTFISLHGAEFRASLRRPVMRAVVRLVVRCCAAVFVLSEADRRAVLAVAGAAAPVVRIANPVSDPVVTETPRVVAPRYVLFLGEQSRRKGLDVLVEAWASLPPPDDRVLVVAGPAGDVTIPNTAGVIDLGPVDYATARELVRSATTLVLPSRAEALPMVLLEAMAVGTPFIATDVSGISDLKAVGAGYVIPPDSVTALAEALTAALSSASLSEMGDRGRAWWAEHASPPAVHEILERHYREASAGRPSLAE